MLLRPLLPLSLMAMTLVAGCDFPRGTGLGADPTVEPMESIDRFSSQEEPNPHLGFVPGGLPIAPAPSVDVPQDAPPIDLDSILSGDIDPEVEAILREILGASGAATPSAPAPSTAEPDPGELTWGGLKRRYAS